MAPRAILSVKYLALPGSVGATKINGFLRYIQYRDHHEQVAGDTSKLLRYVGYRDPTSTRGQLFDRTGRAGDLERKALVAHVKRSVRDLQVDARPQRAVYRFVLSPADARGLDLRGLARSTMQALERDVGQLPPWVAAIHRNTQHPHVHIVMAARREVERERFRTVMVSRPRLARMKEAMNLDMARQLERSPRQVDRHRDVPRTLRGSAGRDGHVLRPTGVGMHRPPGRSRDQATRLLGNRLRRAARNYQGQIEREQLEEERRRQLERGGWER